MRDDLSAALARWLHAGLLDEAAAGRIRSFEEDLEPEQGLRWPAVLAIAFGALMVGAGVLLFVAAHWEQMSPSFRFLAVLAMVAAFHLAGAFFSERSPKLATALHGIGTLVLGAGIFLAGQIFNLEEHWPGGVMLWALGAWLGFLLLRDWVQGSLAALLTPFWLMGEWMEATKRGWLMADGAAEVMAIGFLLLAITYLSVRRRGAGEALHRSLAWIGGLALIPAVGWVIAETHRDSWGIWWGHGRRPRRRAR